MRAVFGLVLAVGIGLAGYAVYMVKTYFDQQRMQNEVAMAAAAAAVPTIEVLAVKEDAPYGKPLTPDDVIPIQYAEPFIPPAGVFFTHEELFPEGDEILRTVTRPMDAMEPILKSKVTEPGRAAGITSQLAAGMRAFAIRVDAATGVSGFLRPGDRVDVYWTGQAPAANGLGTLEVTQLIESAVKIVAVDQTTDSGLSATVAGTVTVEVTPEQVAALAQAQSTGNLSLSLVGAFDEGVSGEIAIDQQTLLGIQPAPEPEPEPEPMPEPEPEPEAKVCTIRNNKGGEVVEIQIPCAD